MEIQIPDFVEQIVNDIKGFKIRSATTIAKACFDTLGKYVDYLSSENLTTVQVLENYQKVASVLVNARPNEPLAQNGVKYVLSSVKSQSEGELSVKELIELLKKYTDNYFALIEDSKNKTIDAGTLLFDKVNTVYTHCNSTTSESILIKLSKKNPNFKVVVDETEPRDQGKITAKNLNQAEVNVLFIEDTAASTVLVHKKPYKVDVVIIGADVIAFDGGVINQIGSLNIALAAKEGGIPFYVVSPSLKYDIATIQTEPKIEERNVSEVWAEAPAGVELYNPVFEKVPANLIEGIICEFGVIKPVDFSSLVQSKYPWLTLQNI